jgi:hypothetical protein
MAGVKATETVQVFIKIDKGRTVCICHAAHKHCGCHCERCEVTRDKFAEWQRVMKRDKYGM